MSGVFAFIGAHKAGAALASVLLVVGATQVGGPDDRTATVTRIVDGDTLDVSYDGDPHRPAIGRPAGT